MIKKTSEFVDKEDESEDVVGLPKLPNKIKKSDELRNSNRNSNSERDDSVIVSEREHQINDLKNSYRLLDSEVAYNNLDEEDRLPSEIAKDKLFNPNLFLDDEPYNTLVNSEDSSEKMKLFMNTTKVEDSKFIKIYLPMIVLLFALRFLWKVIN